MERYIAIDCGKDSTKIAEYRQKENKTKVFKFRTKTSEGSFLDDSLERNTFIAEVDGKVYKIGNGATTPAELISSKSTEAHRLSTITALALFASDNEEDIYHVAAGIPVKEWEVVEKRAAYKDFLLPLDKTFEVTLKIKSDAEPVKKRFTIKSHYAFPESMGALFIDDTASYLNDSAAVIDIGSLNINCTLWNDFELDKEASITDEFGGNILISSLSQRLSAEFSRCSEDYVLKLLKLDKENRYLRPNRPKNIPKEMEADFLEIERQSKILIDEHLLNHVKQIKRRCDARQWSLDFMDLIFIGGTTALLKNEIYTVFGENVYIPSEPEFANVLGFLRILGSKELDLNVPMPERK